MGNPPDVRVRLSAEGQKEVIDAFRKVQAEADKSGKVGSRALDGITQSASSLRNTLRLVGFAAVVTGATLFLKRSIETADAIGELEQKTGIATETLSALSFAAQKAEVEQEQLRTTLVRFTRILDEYDQGAKSAREATRRLFGDARALEGLDQNERLLKVIDALGKLGPGAERTGLAIQFFGRQGAELLPILGDLAKEGLDQLIPRLREMGILVDENLAAAAGRAEDQLVELEGVVRGIATQFAAGLLPSIVQVAEALQAAAGSAESFRQTGETAGQVLKFIILLVATVVLTLRQMAESIVVVDSAFKDFQRDILTGRGLQESLAAFRDRVRGGLAAIDEEIEQRLAKIQAALEGAGQGPTFGRRPRRIVIPPPVVDLGKTLAEDRQVARARRALKEAELDNELAVLRARLGAQQAEERRSFEQNLTSLSEHFANRRRLLEQEAEKELEILSGRVLAEVDELALLNQKLAAERRRALGTGESEEERARKVAQLQAQILAAQKAIGDAESKRGIRLIQLEEQRASLTAEETQRAKALAKELTGFEIELQTLQGDRFAAAEAAHQRRLLELDALLRKEGLAEAERLRRLAEFDQAGRAQIDFERVSEQARKALADLDRDRQQIEFQVQQGILFEFQGQQQIAALEQGRLPVLLQIAAALRAAAISPEQIEQADQFTAALQRLAAGANLSGQRASELKANLEQALTSDFFNFFITGIEQAENFGDAMRGLAVSVLDSLRRIIAQMLATLAVQKLLGIFGFAAGGGIPGGGLAPGVKLAGGGLLRGPGTGTSDSILIRASRGEYVMREAIVRQPGMLELLEELNAGGFDTLNWRVIDPQEFRARLARGYAEGGLVEGESGAGGAGGAGGEARVSLEIFGDETALLRRLESNSQFVDVLLRLNERHRKKFNNALGRSLQ